MAFQRTCFIYLYIVFVFVCVVSAAIQDDNTLTIDVAADNIRNSQKWSTYSPDDVRCYCNLPVCVTTSYMCKSEGGGCFSEVVDIDFDSPAAFRAHDAYKGRHGCLELLETKNKDHRAECQNMPSKRGSHREHSGSLLLCCFKDLCNHIDSPEAQNILNGTRLSATLNDGPNHPPLSSSHELNMAAPGYNSNEVWFKAAIIAVPICGFVILLLLIFLAVKILRTDNLSASSKLGTPYGPHERKSNRDHFDQVHHQSSVSLKKVPLLIHHPHHDIMSSAHTNHSSDELLKHTAVPLLVQNETGLSHSYDKKNEANAKLNMAQGHEYNLVLTKERDNTSSPLLGLQKTLNNTSSNNVYRNVNLSLMPVTENVQQAKTDKLYDKQALSAVINWGNPSPSSSPV